MAKHLNCPNCGASVELKDGIGRCPYCKNLFDETEVRTININKNTNVNKYIHTHHTDDAEVVKAKSEIGENKAKVIVVIIAMCLMLIFVAIPFIMMAVEDAKEKRKEELGMIHGVSSTELTSMDWQEAEAVLRSAGFYNIEFIDLQDHGLFGWKEDDVKSVSINGNTTFGINDWFYKDACIIIIFY